MLLFFVVIHVNPKKKKKKSENSTKPNRETRMKTVAL